MLLRRMMTGSSEENKGRRNWSSVKRKKERKEGMNELESAIETKECGGGRIHYNLIYKRGRIEDYLAYLFIIRE